MNTRRIATFAVGLSLACLTCGEAFGLKISLQLSPQNAESAGFVIKARPENEDGTTTFFISRDLAKANTFDADSDLTIRRYATLRVSGDAGLVIECRLEPTVEQNVLKYRITLARGLLAHAQLTVTEVDDYKNLEGRPHLFGGGTLYEIALDKFSAKPMPVRDSENLRIELMLNRYRRL